MRNWRLRIGEIIASGSVHRVYGARQHRCELEKRGNKKNGFAFGQAFKENEVRIQCSRLVVVEGGWPFLPTSTAPPNVGPGFTGVPRS
jgi:hypothetical protein